METELSDVETKINSIDDEIERLRSEKLKLVKRRDELKVLLQQEACNELAKTNWSKRDFPWSADLESKLKCVFGIHSFRSHQLPTMNVTLSGKDCILIMPTGGGKSLCYQLPALVSEGITLVVSPLVSLMEDQMMALRRIDYPAAMLSASSSKEEANLVQQQMTDKKAPLKLLYVTPEKLAKSKRFMAKLEKMYAMERFSRLAIDEVHCCSQWGHDFRTDYKFLGIMKRQFSKVPILGLTATATTQVIADLQKLLDIERCMVIKASFNRPNLKYEVAIKGSSQEETMDDMAQLISHRFNNQSGIVYCFSIKESEEIAKQLRKRGIRANRYHAQLDSETRSRVHQEWASDTIKVVVATIAFGMGIDKPDVRFVIHHSMSKSVENYYQESGRAGRDDKPASCILFYKFGDIFRQSTMVFTERTGQYNLYAMVSYCLDVQQCRRAILADHFGEQWESTDCKSMCDNCLSQCDVQTVDCTSMAKSIFKIIKHASNLDERLTALKLIDIWQGKGPPKLRPPDVTATTLSREKCERIVALLLLDNYLKEKYHFTPYSTISYIEIGPNSSSVENGLVIKYVFPSKKRKLNFSDCDYAKNLKKERKETDNETSKNNIQNISNCSHSQSKNDGKSSYKKSRMPAIVKEAPVITVSDDDN